MFPAKKQQAGSGSPGLRFPFPTRTTGGDAAAPEIVIL
jgi:hypothetical protein